MTTFHSIPHYQLPESAEQRLRQLHEQLLLLSVLSGPATAQENRYPLELPRSALADCFQQLAAQLADVLQVVHWPLPFGASDEIPPAPRSGQREPTVTQSAP